MKIVIDSKIPFARGVAERYGEVAYIDGAAISAADVREADALIVRTRTRCHEPLLEGSKVQFIATATIGYDHIDTAYLQRAGIAWTNCPGCNARSVAQYVACTLRQLMLHGWRGMGTTPHPVGSGAPLTPFSPADFGRLTIGVVGVGHVGSAVCEAARNLGFGRILLCDPPRHERGDHLPFCSLDRIAREADVITFHTPLTAAPAAHPTFHLADAAFFASLRRRPVIINAARGEVVDTDALLQAFDHDRLAAAVIDTWEQEPHISLDLLSRSFIATPHIAGYSADGKANGTRMALQALATHFGLDTAPLAAVCPPPLPPAYDYLQASNPLGPGATLPADIAAAADLCPDLHRYDPVRDSLALKACPTHFEQLRGHYPLRRE